MRSIALLALLCLTSGVSSTFGGDTGEVSFSADITPLLKRRCAVCHITGEEPGRLSLVPSRAYANLVAVASEQSALRRVEPGQPGNSYLYHKLVGSHVEAGGEGARMPFSAPALPPAQIALFYSWIEQGAGDN